MDEGLDVSEVQDNPEEYNEETLERMMLYAIRKTVAVGRYAEKLRKVKGLTTLNPIGTMVFVDLGNCCKIGGMGQIFENFLSLKQISGYSGEGSEFASVADENYDNSIVQIVRFDQTFRKSCYDVTRDPMYDEKLDTIVKKKRGKRGKYKPRIKPTVRRPKPKSEYFWNTTKDNDVIDKDSHNETADACQSEDIVVENSNEGPQDEPLDLVTVAGRKRTCTRPEDEGLHKFTKTSVIDAESAKRVKSMACTDHNDEQSTQSLEGLTRNRNPFVHSEVSPDEQLGGSIADELNQNVVCKEPSLESGYSSQLSSLSSLSSEQDDDVFEGQLLTFQSL